MSNMAAYQLFQMKDTVENQPYLFKSRSFILDHSGRIHVSRYEMTFESQTYPDISVSGVYELLKHKPRQCLKKRAVSQSDVIVIKKKDDINSYFVDDVGLIQIPDFFSEYTSGSGTTLTADTTGYNIRGMPGKWFVVDTICIEHSMFFLMENEKHGRRANLVILDQSGEIVMDDNQNDFDDEALRRIHLYLHPEESKPAPVVHRKPALELYQRYYENGEYVRSASPENGAEQNYNMIDGTNNNRDPNQRPSVRERLKKKLALVHGGQKVSQERVKL